MNFKLLIFNFFILIICAGFMGTSSDKLKEGTAISDKEFDSGSKINFPALSEKTIEDLELLGKIWGFLKYHHPVIAKGNYNWDYELFRILPIYLTNSCKRRSPSFERSGNEGAAAESVTSGQQQLVKSVL